MYDHEKQYRCTIIRGKSQKEIDDLLPAYAKVLDEICPCNEDEFEDKFNNAFKRFLPVNNQQKKTLDNHRTEISGKLFGMYVKLDDGIIYASERTNKFLKDNDHPAFFKVICYKMQFPNGMQKTSPTVLERINDGICIRPNAFILKFLLVAHKAKINISKREIGYYILNSLDVLQGKASPYEVLEAVERDQKNGIERTIFVPGKEASYNWQHINEQMNYLELANLIRFTDDKGVILNPNEMHAIELFAQDWNKAPDFDVYSYDLSTPKKRKIFQRDWDIYFSCVSSCADQFATSAASLIVDTDTEAVNNNSQTQTTNLTEFGDEGEQIVFEYEKERVSSFNRRLAKKVLALGKTKGLGYDIQSVLAEPGEMSEFVKYIEVKSTKRLTCPDVNDTLWVDTLNVTRNEWVAAQQHRGFYAIYRVYFTRDGVKIFILNDPMQKANDGKLQVTPMTYRIDFSNDAIDGVISGIKKGGGK